MRSNNLTPLRYLIFYITGQGGVGKTTLLNRYREIAQDFSFLLALSQFKPQRKCRMGLTLSFPLVGSIGQDQPSGAAADRLSPLVPRRTPGARYGLPLLVAWTASKRASSADEGVLPL
jgi:hypothetical protein